MMITGMRLKIFLCWVLLLIHILGRPVQAETGRTYDYKQNILSGAVNNFMLAKTVFAGSGLETDEIKLEVCAKLNSAISLTLLELEGSCAKCTWSISDAGEYVRIRCAATDVRCAAEGYEKLTLLLQKTECREPVGVTFRGSKKDGLSSLWQHYTAQYLANCLPAAYVEGVGELNMNSSSFYTGLTNEYLIVNKKRIDLNIASRYDKNSRTTTIYVGSPLIYQDY